MKISFLMALLLFAGCATQPPENPWDGLTVETTPAAPALDCGMFPPPTEALDTDGDDVVDTLLYDTAAVNVLEAYRICAEANQANVDEHALQITQLKIARKGLVEAGQAQRNICDMKQEMLEDERRHRFWTSLGQWGLIAGCAVAVR